MKRYFYLLSICVAMNLMGEMASQYPSFELWNKTSKPIYFAAVSTSSPSDDKVVSEPLVELASKKYVSARFPQIDTGKYTRIVITQNPDSNTFTVYTFNPGKPIWVRVKEEGGKLVFGPQTGPYLGLAGTTERGYPKNLNSTASDYKEQKVQRSKWQQLKKGAKASMYGYTVGG